MWANLSKYKSGCFEVSNFRDWIEAVEDAKEDSNYFGTIGPEGNLFAFSGSDFQEAEEIRMEEKRHNDYLRSPYLTGRI